MNSQTLGFVGLGNMGRPMSARLVAAGFQVIGFDAAGTEERIPPGGAAAASVEDVARQAEVVFLSLPDGAASKTVCARLVGTALRRAQVAVDLSTIGIAAARECAEMVKAAGMTYVDAPVSGGVAGARAGTLSVMVGAEESIFEVLRPVLGVIAGNCFRMGDAPGLGQAMKLLNNYLSATAFAATSEAIVFGSKMGLDMAQMVDVLNVSTGRTTASSDKFPRVVLPRTYDHGFAGALMKKDVTLYLENAEAAGVPREIAAVCARLWQRFNEACPGKDFTYMHKYLEEMSDK